MHGRKHIGPDSDEVPENHTESAEKIWCDHVITNSYYRGRCLLIEAKLQRVPCMEETSCSARVLVHVRDLSKQLTLSDCLLILLSDPTFERLCNARNIPRLCTMPTARTQLWINLYCHAATASANEKRCPFDACWTLHVFSSLLQEWLNKVNL